MKTNQMRSPKSFETERLILKPTSEEDALFLLELLNAPKWLKYIGDRQVKSVEDGVPILFGQKITLRT
jgi:[ribosomal protein S5]-alanine N-acetyltransferase